MLWFRHPVNAGFPKFRIFRPRNREHGSGFLHPVRKSDVILHETTKSLRTSEVSSWLRMNLCLRHQSVSVKTEWIRFDIYFQISSAKISVCLILLPYITYCTGILFFWNAFLFSTSGWTSGFRMKIFSVKILTYLWKSNIFKQSTEFRGHLLCGLKKMTLTNFICFQTRRSAFPWIFANNASLRGFLTVRTAACKLKFKPSDIKVWHLS